MRSTDCALDVLSDILLDGELRHCLLSCNLVSAAFANTQILIQHTNFDDLLLHILCLSTLSAFVSE